MRKIILKGLFLFCLICLINICLVKNCYAEDEMRITDFTSEPLHFVRPKLENIFIVSNQYCITWEYRGTCDGFIIYRKQNDGPWEQLTMLSGTLKDSYYDKDIDFNNEYSYTVSAYEYKEGKLVVSNYDDIGLRYIKAPVITSISKYNIKWELSNNVDGYDIFFSDNNGKLYKIGRVKKHTNFFSIGKYYKKSSYFAVLAYYENETKTVYSSYEKNITLRNNNYSDKKIFFIGDGITVGVTGESQVDEAYVKNDVLNGIKVERPYTKRVEMLTGAKATVNGNRGDKASDIVSRVEKDSKYFKNYDIVCIAIGTNDYNESIQLGRVTDTDKTTFYGQLNYIIEQIREQNKDAKIVFITPLYRNSYNKRNNVNCYVLNNSIGVTLDDYCEAIRQVANYRGAYVYDSDDYGVINVDNVRLMTVDLIHPTQLAHCKLGCSISEFLIEYGILED